MDRSCPGAEQFVIARRGIRDGQLYFLRSDVSTSPVYSIVPNNIQREAWRGCYSDTGPRPSRAIVPIAIVAMALVIFVTGTRQTTPPALIAAVRKTANKLSFILNQIITSHQSFYILCFGTLNVVTRAQGRCFVAGLLGCNLSL